MKKSLKNSLVMLIPLGILILVTVFSLMPPRALPSVDGWFVDIPFGDKLVHFGFYFSVVTAFRFGRTYTKGYTSRCPWVMLTFAVLYGGAIELLQGAYFGRGCDIWDEVANILGAVAALWLIPQRWHERLADRLGREIE